MEVHRIDETCTLVVSVCCTHDDELVASEDLDGW